MRILIIHNQYWAHYKSKLFFEIYEELKRSVPESHFEVVHIAMYEASRKGMKDPAKFQYDYPNSVLFNKAVEEVGFKEKLIALFRTFNQQKPTVLNVTGYFDPAQVLLMLYARLKGVKVVLSSESSTMDHERSRLKEGIKKGIVSLAHKFFCFGTSSTNYLKSLGVLDANIPVQNAAVVDEEVIYNEYVQSKTPTQAPTRKFIYVGRLASEKNLTMLVRAFVAATSDLPAGKDWELMFVGDGPEAHALKALTQPYPQITFTGGMPWYEVPRYLAKCDVFVLPSKSEPWGLVVNEAMVCEMPVIVSASCGCAEDLVQDSKNGFIFDPNRESELENALRYFINNPDQISKMGQVSKTLITPFSSKNVAVEMINCYKKL
jgi:glycosyltransferase involved in cell wall biosynthesis